MSIMIIQSCSFLPMGEKEYFDRSLKLEANIVCDSTKYHYIKPIKINIKFSKPVVEFTEADISITNAYITNLITDDNTNYNAEIIPLGLDISLYIPKLIVVDKYGNTNRSESNTINLVADIMDIGYISDMCISGSDRYVYGLDLDKSRLYLIDTIQEDIANTIQLKHEYPTAMDYSEIDKKLYIVYAYQGVVDIYDEESGGITTYTFEQGIGGNDIKVDSIHRRIYVRINGYIYILDMDTGANIKSLCAMDGIGNIELDEKTQTIFTDEYGSWGKLYKYSVANDQIVLLQSIALGVAKNEIRLNPDHSMLLFVASTGDYLDRVMCLFDVNDITKVLKVWDIGDYVVRTIFNPKHNIAYSISRNNNLYIIDTTSDKILRTVEFPNTDYCTAFTTNKNGTIGVGYSSYNRVSDFELYFFKNVL